MTYFDHAATTPIHPQVIETMTNLMPTLFGNPSSIHQYGRAASEKLMAARQVIAESLAVQPHEIIFNGGGTEGDNTALISTAFARKEQGRHIITTQIEHPAILQTAAFLEQQGFEFTYLSVDQSGMIDLEAFKQALREDTILVSVMFANNETGNLMPIKEIGAILQTHPAYFHTDAVQAFGKVPIYPYELGIDLLSVSAHKINGPKGTGFLFKRDGLQLPALLHGGEQEEKRRAGTENLISICGMATAVTINNEESQQAHTIKYQKFADTVKAILDEEEVTYHLNGNQQAKMPHILNLAFPGVDNQMILMHMDLKGFAISTGSACTAGNVDPSHVLIAMYGKNSPYIRESIRISFGLGNTQEEVETFAHQLSASVKRLQKKAFTNNKDSQS